MLDILKNTLKLQYGRPIKECILQQEIAWGDISKSSQKQTNKTKTKQNKLETNKNKNKNETHEREPSGTNKRPKKQTWFVAQKLKSTHPVDYFHEF